MPMQLKLYGTQFCHLCDEAEAVLHEIGVAFEYVDIADDGGLVKLYGMRIPVLKRLDTGAELGWSFDTEGVVRFLNG